MKRILIAAALLAALSGCYKQAETVSVVGAGFTVEKLFTQDGITVYRFKDGNEYHYFTNGKGSITSVESCGKDCTRPEETQ